MLPAFQAFVMAVLSGISNILPLSASAHRWAIPYLLEWQMPSAEFHAWLSFGSLLALLVFFRHDWASILSSFLRVLIFWKRPSTIDERIPFFIALSALPPLGIGILLKDQLAEGNLHPLWMAGSLIVFGIPLQMASGMNRKLKNLFNWNWIDSLIIGICQSLLLIPGAGRQEGALSAVFLRNYIGEASMKLVGLTFAPILIYESLPAFRHFSFSAAEAGPDFSWLSLGVAFVAAFFSSLIALGALNKNLLERGMGGYIVYRWILALGIVATYFIRG